MIAVLALVGLAASSILLAEYTAATAVFCGAGGGCDVVRGSPYAQILGIDTPWLGVIFFAVALGLALWQARRLLLAWAAAGAGASLVFFAIQLLVLKAVCIYCATADGAAILLFALVLLTRPLPRFRRAAMLAAVAVAAGVVATPVVITRLRRPGEPAAPVPPVILREQRAGQATIVEFVDFECPFCRRLHETFKAIAADYGAQVRIVRKQHPLATLHEHAMTAAQAACCAEEAGAGDRMADALFAAPPGELTAEGCALLASAVGVSRETFESCMASDRPAARVAADAADAKAAGIGQEAPVFFVGATRFRGAQRAELIRAAIDRELARR